MVPEAGDPQQTTGRVSALRDPSDDNPMVVSCVIILQAEKEVVASMHSSPLSTSDLTEYIAIKLTTSFYTTAVGGHSVYSSKFRGPLSISTKISVWATSKDPFSNFNNPLSRDLKGDNNDNARLIEQVTLPDDVDIVDGEQHSLKIEYDKEVLKIYIDQYTAEPVVIAPVSITDVITLDNGSCYIGIAQETAYTNNILEVFNWSLTSSTQSFSKDSWSGLSLEYKPQWPVHLFISPEIIEQYNKLFRFLFPLRRVQIDLQNDWNNLKHIYSVFDQSQMRFILAMRAKLNSFINNIMSYLQLDVIETQWVRLYKGIEK